MGVAAFWFRFHCRDREAVLSLCRHYESGLRESQEQELLCWHP
jgi:hypothetical protein